MDDLALGGNRLATNHRTTGTSPVVANQQRIGLLLVVNHHSTGASPVVVPDLSRKCPIFSLRVSRQKLTMPLIHLNRGNCHSSFRTSNFALPHSYFVLRTP